MFITRKRQRVDLTNRINKWNDEGREIKKNIEKMEAEQMQLMQELYVCSKLRQNFDHNLDDKSARRGRFECSAHERQ